MRKVIASLVFAVSLFATESNVVTLSDLKEATYKLIMELRSLKAGSSVEKEKLLAELNSIQERLEHMINTNSSEIEKIKRKLSSISVRVENDGCDDIIDEFVRKNSHLLPESCRE